MIKTLDLFAGMGGMRLGFEQACTELQLETECVMTSEIKKSAITVYNDNFTTDVVGDIKKIDPISIPDFDVLLAGFPCQPFSCAGLQQGFDDTRGTLFFNILEILNAKKPAGFILENVMGLVSHGGKRQGEVIGETLKTMLRLLESIGYTVSWEVLNAKDFGVPQNRKRIFIVGSKNPVDLTLTEKTYVTFPSIQERDKPCNDSEFTRALLHKFPPDYLVGKAIKDSRGGKNNIHSWDFDYRGMTTQDQKDLLNQLFKQRRRRKWAVKKQVAWVDGMPLTFGDISSFYSHDNLQFMLDDLVKKDYLRLTNQGYNIVSGGLSFEFSAFIGDYSNTLTATAMSHIGVIDNGIRRITNVECCRLFGFPDDFVINVTKKQRYDLFGNTVVVPVVAFVATQLIKSL